MAKLEAIPPADSNKDNTLPDPDRRASGVAFVLVVGGMVLAGLLNAIGLNTAAYDPSKAGAAANIALFAGFYVGAQVVERLAEYVAPFVPWWTPTGADEAAQAAQLKADRAKIMLGITFVMGVGASCAFGLLFLQAIGMTRPSDAIDSIVTGLAIAGGTKGVHDTLSLIQNASSPTTGTAAG